MSYQIINVLILHDIELSNVVKLLIIRRTYNHWFLNNEKLKCSKISKAADTKCYSKVKQR